MKLINVLTSQSGGTEDLDLRNGSVYICFVHEGRDWAVDVYCNSLERWYIRGGVIGEKWDEAVELSKEEIKKYQEWCGL
jgi:hypothetical protein